MYLIDRVGRKSLIIASGIGMGTCHALTAYSYYHTEHSQQHADISYPNISNITMKAGNDNNVDESTYLPLIGIVGFYLTFAIGTGSVPMVILGEVFPQSVKGTAISIINSGMWVLNFGMSKMFFFMNQVLGIYGTFLFFGVSSIIMSLYVVICLPETKNKTLNEIQQKVESKRIPTQANKL